MLVNRYTDVVKSLAISLILISLPVMANIAPVITSLPQNKANQGVLYEYTITADDEDGDPELLNFNVSVLPSWLSYNSSTHTIAGTPDNADVGNHNVKLSVSDGIDIVSQIYSVEVKDINDAPVLLTNITNSELIEDVEFNRDISGNFSDIDKGDVLTFTSTTLPSGLIILSSGIITGAPDNAAALKSPHTVIILANDKSNASVSATFQISVQNVNDAPTPVDDTVSVSEDGTTNIDILLNDIDVDDEILPSTAFITTTPLHGQVTINTLTGLVTYTPTADYNGSDSFRYRITDPSGLVGTATVNITVEPTNDAPTANNDVASTLEDTPVEIDVIANDTDPDVGDAVQGSQIVIETAPQNGQAVPVNNKVRYTPNANFSGTDSFTYKSADSVGALTGIATVTITVGPVNDIPVAGDDVAATFEDTAVTFVVINNDSDTEDGSIDIGSLKIVNQATHGTGSINTDGSITYTPNWNYNGSDSLQYTVTDSRGLTSNAATVSITINPVNDYPVAYNDLVTLAEDEVLDINILGNDQDVDGNDTIDSKSVIITTAPVHGSLFVDSSSGIVKFTPTSDYFGNDTFSYTVADGQGLVSNIAQVQLTITSVNDAPRLTDDTATTDEDTTVTITILPNDSDIDGTLAVSTLEFTQQPVHGTVTFNASGQVIYVPDLDYHGNDQFTYNIQDDLNAKANKSATVLITINSINDVPIAIAGNGSLHEDKTLDITLKGTDVDEDTLGFNIVIQPTHGVLSGKNANWLYTPEANYNGPDNFTFNTTDSLLTSQPVDFVIDVIAVNDRPVATAQVVSFDEDTSIDITFSGTDIDSTHLTFRLAGGELGGTITGSPPTVTYTPSANFNGQEYILFIANDGSLDSSSEKITIEVQAVNDDPTVTGQDLFLQEDSSIAFKLKANDIDGDSLSYIIVTPAAHGVISGTAPNLIYQPTENYNGNDLVVFKVNDGTSDSANASVTFTITASDDAPSATAQTVVGDEDADLPITLQGTDPDENPLSYQILTNPTHGILEGTPPNLTYHPNQDFNGTDQFKFKVSDGNFDSGPAIVTLKIEPVNDQPVAYDDIFTRTMSGTTWLTLDVLANDQDLDNDPLTIQSVTTDFGSVAINNNRLRYVPEDGFSGDVILQYRIEDPAGGSDTAIVYLTITNNTDPQAPSITAPAELSLIAKGRLTKVALGSATAVDVNGNIIPVELVANRNSYPPGTHTVYWKATDQQGRVAIASQKVNIYPLVSLTRGQKVQEGNEVTVKVKLNGPAPIYPIVIPYTIEGTATSGIDYELSAGQIKISSGTQTELTFATFADDLPEQAETVIIKLGDTPYKSSDATHIITIIETNATPRVSLFSSQDSEKRFKIERQGGIVQVTATIDDANPQDEHLIEWMASDGIVRTNSPSDDQFEFSAAQMTVGIYKIGAKVIDNGTPSLMGESEIFIELVNKLTTLGQTDSDGDLISDKIEGHQDSDGDHIADYLDPINDCALVPERVDEQRSYLIEGQVGGCIRRGTATLYGQSGGMEVDSTNTPLPADTDATNIGGVFDFVIHDIEDNASKYSIVIPQRNPVPKDAIYRKYNSEQGWHTFVSDDNNSLWSTAGNLGICPPPNDSRWVKGLHTGDWCVQLTIEDGGANDDDGLVNQIISDPGGISVYNSSNHLPQAVADTGQMLWNSSAQFDVRANDSDADNDMLTIISAQAQLGVVEIDQGLQLTYTALQNFVGIDEIDYTISDGHGGIASTTLTITIRGNNVPKANNDNASTTNTVAITINVLANDSDEDGDSLTITSATADVGIVAITSDQKLLYTPKTGFEGTVTLDYTIKDNQGAVANAKVYIVVSAPVVVTPPPTDTGGNTNGGSSSGGGSWGYGLLALSGLIWVRRLRRRYINISSINTNNSSLEITPS